MSSHLSGACTGSSEVACRRMQISTLDISGITTTVRRHEALLRFARYLFVYNVVILLWVVITKLSQMPSFDGLLELIAGLDWKFAALVLGSVGASYLILAHRLWWAFAVIMVAQVGYFFYASSAELAVIRASILFAIGVITLPPMRPLAPLATDIAIMVICFCYIMIVLCLYSTAWAVSGGRVPPGAYGRRLAPLEPLRPSRLLDTFLPGHRSENVTLWEAAVFALSSLLFVTASMAPFYGFRRVQNEFQSTFANAGPAGMSDATSRSDDCLLGAILSLEPAGDRPWSAHCYRRCLPRTREPPAPLRQATFRKSTCRATDITGRIDPFSACFSRRSGAHSSGKPKPILDLYSISAACLPLLTN